MRVQVLDQGVAALLGYQTMLPREGGAGFGPFMLKAMDDFEGPFGGGIFLNSLSILEQQAVVACIIIDEAALELSGLGSLALALAPWSLAAFAFRRLGSLLESPTAGRGAGRSAFVDILAGVDSAIPFPVGYVAVGSLSRVEVAAVELEGLLRGDEERKGKKKESGNDDLACHLEGRMNFKSFRWCPLVSRVSSAL